MYYKNVNAVDKQEISAPELPGWYNLQVISARNNYGVIPEVQ